MSMCIVGVRSASRLRAERDRALLDGGERRRRAPAEARTAMTVLARFTEEFPDREETRIIMLLNKATGEEQLRLYLDERFCADPECDCQRMMLYAIDEERVTRAAIGYDFTGLPGRTPDGVNPFLEPGVHQPPWSREDSGVCQSGTRARRRLSGPSASPLPRAEGTHARSGASPLARGTRGQTIHGGMGAGGHEPACRRAANGA